MSCDWTRAAPPARPPDDDVVCVCDRRRAITWVMSQTPLPWIDRDCEFAEFQLLQPLLLVWPLESSVPPRLCSRASTQLHDTMSLSLYIICSISSGSRASKRKRDERERKSARRASCGEACACGMSRAHAYCNSIIGHQAAVRMGLPGIGSSGTMRHCCSPRCGFRHLSSSYPSCCRNSNSSFSRCCSCCSCSCCCCSCGMCT